MKLSKQEQLAIQKAVEFGELYGFGNLIAHLKSAWAAKLMQDWGFEEKQALVCADSNAYSFALHKDLRDNGEWDETGEKYK